MEIRMICVLLTFSFCVAPVHSADPFDSDSLDQFGRELEDLRNKLELPGMAAAIVKDQRIVWAQGFGYADLENGIPVTRDTPFHLASVTKTYASTILMRLVERGALDLDDPVSNYGIELQSRGTNTVRHLVSHTSEGTPGARSTRGRILPYGLGWFSQSYQGTRVIWHCGWWPPHVSSLYLKVPEHSLSFIILGNTEALSKGFGLHRGNVQRSPAARLFLQTFVF